MSKFKQVEELYNDIMNMGDTPEFIKEDIGLETMEETMDFIELAVKNKMLKKTKRGKYVSTELKINI